MIFILYRANRSFRLCLVYDYIRIRPSRKSSAIGTRSINRLHLYRVCLQQTIWFAHLHISMNEGIFHSVFYTNYDFVQDEQTTCDDYVYFILINLLKGRWLNFGSNNNRNDRWKPFYPFGKTSEPGNISSAFLCLKMNLKNMRKKKQKKSDNNYEFSKRRIQLLYICVMFGSFADRFIPFLGMHDERTFENCSTVAAATRWLI